MFNEHSLALQGLFTKYARARPDAEEGELSTWSAVVTAGTTLNEAEFVQFAHDMHLVPDYMTRVRAIEVFRETSSMVLAGGGGRGATGLKMDLQAFVGALYRITLLLFGGPEWGKAYPTGETKVRLLFFCMDKAGRYFKNNNTILQERRRALPKGPQTWREARRGLDRVDRFKKPPAELEDTKVPRNSIAGRRASTMAAAAPGGSPSRSSRRSTSPRGSVGFGSGVSARGGHNAGWGGGNVGRLEPPPGDDDDGAEDAGPLVAGRRRSTRGPRRLPQTREGLEVGVAADEVRRAVELVRASEAAEPGVAAVRGVGFSQLDAVEHGGLPPPAADPRPPPASDSDSVSSEGFSDGDDYSGSSDPDVVREELMRDAASINIAKCTDALYGLFTRYCRHSHRLNKGPSATLSSSMFYKLLRDCGVLDDHSLSHGDVDIVYKYAMDKRMDDMWKATRFGVMPGTSSMLNRRLNFRQFLTALSIAAARKYNGRPDELTASHGESWLAPQGVRPVPTRRMSGLLPDQDLSSIAGATRTLLLAHILPMCIRLGDLGTLDEVRGGVDSAPPSPTRQSPRSQSKSPPGPGAHVLVKAPPPPRERVPGVGAPEPSAAGAAGDADDLRRVRRGIEEELAGNLNGIDRIGMRSSGGASSERTATSPLEQQVSRAGGPGWAEGAARDVDDWGNSSGRYGDGRGAAGGNAAKQKASKEGDDGDIDIPSFSPVESSRGPSDSPPTRPAAASPADASPARASGVAGASDAADADSAGGAGGPGGGSGTASRKRPASVVPAEAAPDAADGDDDDDDEAKTPTGQEASPSQKLPTTDRLQRQWQNQWSRPTDSSDRTLFSSPGDASGAKRSEAGDAPRSAGGAREPSRGSLALDASPQRKRAGGDGAAASTGTVEADRAAQAGVSAPSSHPRARRSSNPDQDGTTPLPALGAITGLTPGTQAFADAIFSPAKSAGSGDAGGWHPAPTPGSLGPVGGGRSSQQSSEIAEMKSMISQLTKLVLQQQQQQGSASRGGKQRSADAATSPAVSAFGRSSAQTRARQSPHGSPIKSLRRSSSPGKRRSPRSRRKQRRIVNLAATSDDEEAQPPTTTAVDDDARGDGDDDELPFGSPRGSEPPAAATPTAVPSYEDPPGSADARRASATAAAAAPVWDGAAVPDAARAAPAHAASNGHDGGAAPPERRVARSSTAREHTGRPSFARPPSLSDPGGLGGTRAAVVRRVPAAQHTRSPPHLPQPSSTRKGVARAVPARMLPFGASPPRRHSVVVTADDGDDSIPAVSSTGAVATTATQSGRRRGSPRKWRAFDAAPSFLRSLHEKLVPNAQFVSFLDGPRSSSPRGELEPKTHNVRLIIHFLTRHDGTTARVLELTILVTCPDRPALHFRTRVTPETFDAVRDNVQVPGAATFVSLASALTNALDDCVMSPDQAQLRLVESDEETAQLELWRASARGRAVQELDLQLQRSDPSVIREYAAVQQTVPLPPSLGVGPR